MNHNEIVGWRFPENILQQSQVIYLYSDHDHERVEKRMEICREIFEKRSNPIIDMVAEGASLGRAGSRQAWGNSRHLLLASRR